MLTQVETMHPRGKSSPPCPFSVKGCGIPLCVLVFLVLISTVQAALVDSKEQLTALKNQELALAERLIQACPQSEEPLVIMGNVHSRHGNTDKAMAFWNQAAQKNPKRVDVYHKMAEVTFQMDRMKEAIVLWRQVVEVDPKIQGAHVKIAEALMNLGDYEQCIAEARKEIEIGGKESVETAILLGRAYQHLQNYEEARQHYEQVIAVDSGHMNAYYGLYNVCIQLKDREAAKGYITKYRDLKTEHKEALRQEDEALPSDIDCFYQSLAKFAFDIRLFYLQTKQDAAAEAVLKQGMSMGQSSPAFFKRLAELYASAGGDREALGLYARLTQLTPNDITCYVKVGVLSVQLGLLDVAEKAFGEVITRDPEGYVGYQELSRLYVRMKKNLPEALQMAKMAVLLKPSAAAYYDLALASFVNRDPEAALIAMEQAVQLDPGDPRYTKALALFRQKKGDIQ